jgi:hypothetical protein
MPARLCFQFAQLARASDERIVELAGRWGPLGFDLRAEEDIRDWRRYAALAGALLRFTSEHAVGRRSEKEDWRIICEFVFGAADRDDLKIREQTAVTALAVNTWFARARGHRILGSVDGVLQIRPNTSNLFGILITQIAHVMARTDQMAVCAGCKRAFTPERPISRGSRQYCRRFRKAKVPGRDASRDWRKRAREEAPKQERR